MRTASLIALAALTMVLAPRTATAQEIAYSVPGTTNVRAGPGVEYPVVARVRGGVEIYVYGCLSDRAWCDVRVFETRGWMSARRLEFVYGGSRVLVPEYYAYFGAPYISFDFGYWDRYYEDRPFYRKWRRHRPPRLDGPPMTDPLPDAPANYYRPNPPGDVGGVYPSPPPADFPQRGPGGPPIIGGGGLGDDLPGGAGLCPPGVVCP
jgi:uncharacterized protein YraI